MAKATEFYIYDVDNESFVEDVEKDEQIMFKTKSEADAEIAELAAEQDRHISDWQIHDDLGGVYSRENKCTSDVNGINPDYPETYAPAA